MAPHADSVKLSSSDIPDSMFGSMMTRGAAGIWEITVGSVPGGAYRYNFEVDGVSVIDPRNPATSEANEHTLLNWRDCLIVVAPMLFDG